MNVTRKFAEPEKKLHEISNIFIFLSKNKQTKQYIALLKIMNLMFLSTEENHMILSMTAADGGCTRHEPERPQTS